MAERPDPAVSTVLLDLDGVVRHFDTARLGQVERDHGLPVGAILEAAFSPGLIDRVITGRMAKSAWVDQVGRMIGSPAAAAAWAADPGRVDDALLTVVDRLRAGGTTVAILTNGTDTVPAELEALGVVNRFDRLFNSAEIGVAKPDRRAFEHVCSALAVEPAAVFFTDDSPAKLAGATEIGMRAEPYVGLDAFIGQVTALGLLPASA